MEYQVLIPRPGYLAQKWYQAITCPRNLVDSGEILLFILITLDAQIQCQYVVSLKLACRIGTFYLLR